MCRSPSLTATRPRRRPWRRRWRAAAPALLDALDRELPRADGKSPSAGHRGPTPADAVVVEPNLPNLLHNRRRQIRHPAASGEGEATHGRSAEQPAWTRRKISRGAAPNAAAEEEVLHLQKHRRRRHLLLRAAG